MLPKSKSVAPEPYFSAYLELLYRIFIRLRSDYLVGEPLQDEQMADLMDAIHNIPHMLLESGGEGSGYDAVDIKNYFLREYDSKWATNEGAFRVSLVGLLEDCIGCVIESDADDVD